MTHPNTRKLTAVYLIDRLFCFRKNNTRINSFVDQHDFLWFLAYLLRRLTFVNCLVRHDVCWNFVEEFTGSDDVTLKTLTALRVCYVIITLHDFYDHSLMFIRSTNSMNIPSRNSFLKYEYKAGTFTMSGLNMIGMITHSFLLLRLPLLPWCRERCCNEWVLLPGSLYRLHRCTPPC